MTLETYLGDLGTYLQTNSIGTVGTNIHYFGFDADTGNDITLTPFEGVEFRDIVSGEVNPYHPSLSILVRNSDAATALSTSNMIYKLLRNISNQTIGTTRFMFIEASSPPGFISKTQSGYYIFSINFSLLIQ